MKYNINILILNFSLFRYYTIHVFNGKDQVWKRPPLKNEMEALITNHVKEYVLTNT